MRQPTPDVLGKLLGGEERTFVAVDDIRIDGGTQMRAGLNAETVEEYRQWLDELARQHNGLLKMPPVILFHDGGTYWLADGFHRLAAWKLHGSLPTAVHADVRSGTRRDAVLFAAGANAAHGLRRTNSDKRRSVETLLLDNEWCQWPDNDIASACNVSREYVVRVRASMREKGDLSCDRSQDAPGERTVTRGGASYTMNVTNIGATHSLAIPATPPPEPRVLFIGSDLENAGWSATGNGHTYNAANARTGDQASGFANYNGMLGEVRRLQDLRDVAEVATIEAEPVDAVLSPVPISRRDGYESDEWYTPAKYIEAARAVMGSIDLDPASCELAQTVVKADVYLTKVENGLSVRWIRECIWLNPPYADVAPWVNKLIAEFDDGHFVKQAVVLLNNNTETGYCQALLARFPVCLLNQRIQFWRSGQAGETARQGQVIFYLGPNVERFVSVFQAFGPILRRIE